MASWDEVHKIGDSLYAHNTKEQYFWVDETGDLSHPYLNKDAAQRALNEYVKYLNREPQENAE